MVLENQKKGTLELTTSVESALKNSNICFIAVGTPMSQDGSADLQYVLEVANNIGKYIKQNLIVVGKSTVPVGTADKVREAIQNELDKRSVNVSFDVVSNPEFLKEGAAIDDFMHPGLVGTSSLLAYAS
jgi:UDPglucose 6-dehydrogenase